MYRMQRRHNNNVVQAIDDHGRSVVLLGRGIGFGVSVGDSIDKTRIEMTYVLESQQHAASIAVRLSSLSPEILILTRHIVVAAHDRLGIDNAEALLLPVAEHMSFAVDRAGAGKYVDFPLETEIRHLFPKEYEFGQHVLKMIIAELGVSLPASEAAAFALHVVSMQFGRSRISRAVAMTQLVDDILRLVSEHLGFVVSRDDFATRRFVTHLRFVLGRFEKQGPEVKERRNFVHTIKTSMPSYWDVAVNVQQHIEEQTHATLGLTETAYLTLHIGNLAEGR